MDFTADSEGETDTTEAILEYFSEKVPLSQMSLSSDAYGYIVYLLVYAWCLIFLYDVSVGFVFVFVYVFVFVCVCVCFCGCGVF